MWCDYNATTVELEMAYGTRVGMRVFLNYVVWQAERDQAAPSCADCRLPRY